MLIVMRRYQTIHALWHWFGTCSQDFENGRCLATGVLISTGTGVRRLHIQMFDGHGHTVRMETGVRRGV